MKLDTPNVNIAKKSNEENISAINSWARNTIAELMNYINNLEARVESLEKKGDQ